jgi:hypothetical protein
MRRVGTRTLLVVLAIALLCTPPRFAIAATWVVDGAGGGHFTVIQNAVYRAAAGDTVLVRSGVYHEWVRIFGAKSGLHLIGDGPPESIIIQADTIAVDVRDTDPPVRIQGLTITGNIWYGSLYTMQARAEVIGCIFRDTVGPGGCQSVGGAINAMLQSDLTIEDCIIENNTGWEAPGGVIIWESRADIRHNIFRGNSACYGGGLEIYHCETQPVSYIEDNLFIGNSVSDWGGALFNVDSSPVICGNTFYANDAPDNAAIWVLGGRPVITGNIIAGSDWGVYCQTDPRYPQSLPILGCNLFWNVGQGAGFDCPDLGNVIEADPLFCDAESGDFSLCEDSPAFADSCGPLGASGIGCPPCGDVRAVPSTWGTIKALYR